VNAARAAAFAIGCIAAAAAAAQTDVQPFAAHYAGHKKVALFTATAQARIELQRSALYLRYTMHTNVRWAVLERRIRDCSVMRIDGGRLWPLEYRHLDGSDAQNNVHTRFDWLQGKASTLRGTAASPQVQDIAWPTWDPMSFQVALMAAAPQRVAASVETHRVVERGGLKEHRVEFAGAMLLDSVPVHRIVSRKGEDEVLLWLLPQQGWQPQRLTIDEVTIERTGVANAAVALVAGHAPQCDEAPP
jgi:hypothetical protein